MPRVRVAPRVPYTVVAQQADAASSNLALLRVRLPPTVPKCEYSSTGRAPAFQAGGRGFKPRCSLQRRGTGICPGPAALRSKRSGKLCIAVYETDGRGKYVGCSSVGRAPDCGSGGRGIETRQPPHGSVVQLVSASDCLSEDRGFESRQSRQTKEV